MKDYFEQLLKKSNIKLDNSKVEILLKYLRLLTEKNKVMNLTAIRDEKEILEKHFIDSLLLSELFLHTDKKILNRVKRLQGQIGAVQGKAPIKVKQCFSFYSCFSGE